MFRRYHKIIITTFLLFAAGMSWASATEETEEIFVSQKSKDEFAKDISSLIGKTWKAWQDAVVINNVDIEGASGRLTPGNISGPVLTSRDITNNLDRTGKSKEYINCIRAVAGAISDGMRAWQRGYFHSNIPFPQGASCVYTLPPCNNVPVAVSSGSSQGDKKMTEEELYNNMLYHAASQEKKVKEVLKASSKAIALCFEKWKKSCSIIGIVATGGIAPAPSPMGSGPGPVRGAKGEGGKLVGAYFNSDFMCEEMNRIFQGK